MQNRDYFERPVKARESGFDISCAESDYIDHVAAKSSLFDKLATYLALALIMAAFFNGHQIDVVARSVGEYQTQADRGEFIWPSATSNTNADQSHG